jgi:hypothetical protein
MRASILMPCQLEPNGFLVRGQQRSRGFSSHHALNDLSRSVWVVHGPAQTHSDTPVRG